MSDTLLRNDEGFGCPSTKAGRAIAVWAARVRWMLHGGLETDGIRWAAARSAGGRLDKSR